MFVKGSDWRAHRLGREVVHDMSNGRSAVTRAHRVMKCQVGRRRRAMSDGDVVGFQVLLKNVSGSGRSLQVSVGALLEGVTAVEYIYGRAGKSVTAQAEG